MDLGGGRNMARRSDVALPLSVKAQSNHSFIFELRDRRLVIRAQKLWFCDTTTKSLPVMGELIPLVVGPVSSLSKR